MSDILKPQSADEVLEVIRWAADSKSPLELFGRASKRTLGRPLQPASQMDLSALSGVMLYEPEELILQALPGTPLSEIQDLLDQHGQILAFEPPDYGLLLGQPADRGSLGGALACNLAGPRRPKAGAARDHFLGVEGISGRGELFKAGGRVVKNVTGYDVMKLLAGSYGTLAAMTQVTIKVLPRPEKTYSLLLFGLDEPGANLAMNRALSSAHEVTGVAFLSSDLSTNSAVSYVREAGGSVTALRLEGPGPSVQYRSSALRNELADLAPSEFLHSHNSLVFWQEVRDLSPLGDDAQQVIWRLSLPPAQSATTVRRLKESLEDSRVMMDWGGGLIWLSLPRSEDAQYSLVRAALADSGGHATLFKAPASLRAAVPVFEPLPAALRSLTKRIKTSFDPQGILNPGRLYQDF